MNKQAFLIISLPRSRTAWLSNFFTVGDVSCSHDLTVQFHTGEGSGPEHVDIEGLADAILAQPARVCGSACAGNLWIFRELMLALQVRTTRVPGLIFVRRPWRDVLTSFARVCELPVERCEELIHSNAELLRDAARETGGLVVHWDELDEVERMRKLWKEATFGSGIPFPQMHWEKMRTMRVEIHPQRMRDAAHRVRTEGVAV